MSPRHGCSPSSSTSYASGGIRLRIAREVGQVRDVVENRVLTNFYPSVEAAVEAAAGTTRSAHTTRSPTVSPGRLRRLRVGSERVEEVYERRYGWNRHEHYHGRRRGHRDDLDASGPSCQPRPRDQHTGGEAGIDRRVVL